MECTGCLNKFHNEIATLMSHVHILEEHAQAAGWIGRGAHGAYRVSE